MARMIAGIPIVCPNSRVQRFRSQSILPPAENDGAVPCCMAGEPVKLGKAVTLSTIALTVFPERR